MALTDIYVIDKNNGQIHRIGANPHDLLYVDRKGVLCYYNLQNSCGCSGNGYDNGEKETYAFLPQDQSMPMDYEHFNQPEKCFLDEKSVCGYPITECANCPNRKVIKNLV